ncbi:hypothetical protein AS034_16270 [[Bacillus] enclensis]|uniref:Membrane protein involved in the export of O-antigen and teichoic acid n=1 Tax=[Bacillus] enclensis TaxID=1402860 RepID=A0A0V8HDE5_9BACI|nr:oligosaccharide flippase family protein [[Bacillus] enclensis]KSU60396.1 hypothetical protein AS034_16270 [[Bacillus] enclensis]SCC24038.1 Membrane protein involved in the export of O-antigen and teichoic acid [[Bacillus] enclensis]
MLYKKIKSNFLRKVLLLSSSTIMAQLIMLIISPILTRVYSPESFGELAIFLSFILILSEVSSLKYDMAILIPSEKEDNKTDSLIFLSILVVIIVSVCSIPLLSILNQFGFFILSYKGLLWFLPLTVFISGIYQIFTFYSIKKGDYKFISGTKINLVASQGLSQLGLGYIYPSSVSLILGDFLGRIVVCISIFNKYKSKILSVFIKKDFMNILAVAKEYRKYPLVNAPSSLINSVGTNIIPILLTIVYDPIIAGLYALSYRMIRSPIQIIGKSISSVYIGDIVNQINNKSEIISIKDKTFKIIKIQIILGVIPFSILAIFSPSLFSILFGEEWIKSGYVVRYLSPMLLMMLIVSPISEILNIIQKHEFRFYWDIIRLVVIMVIFFVSNVYELPNEIFFMVYSLSMTIMYIILLFIIYIQLDKYVIKKN